MELISKFIARKCVIPSKDVLLSSASNEVIIGLLREEKNVALDQIRVVQKGETKRITDNIIEICEQNEFFRNGILHSTDTLLDSIDRYITKSNTVKNKKYRAVFDKVYKFILRSALKTNPLSSFVEVFEGEFKTIEHDSEDFLGLSISQTANYKFSKNFHYFFLKKLIRTRQSISEKDSNYVRINRSLFQVESDNLHACYYEEASEDGFKEFELSEIIKVVIDRLAFPKTIKELLMEICDEFDSEPSQIQNVLSRLIEEQIIIVDNQSEQICLKQPIEINEANWFESSGISTRVMKEINQEGLINREWLSQFWEELIQAKVNVDGLKKWKLITGDLVSDRKVMLNYSYSKKQIETLSSLVGVLKGFDGKIDNLSVIKKVHTDLFEAKEIGFWEFYYNYWKYVKNNEENLDKVKAGYQLKRSEWKEELKRRVSLNVDNNHVSVNLELKDFEGLEDFGIESIGRESYSVFLKFFENDGKSGTFVDGVSVGYGRSEGRFLDYFPKLHKKIFDNNIKVKPDIIDITDYNFFNGNFHPRITNYEISTSNVVMNQEVEKVDLANVVVREGENGFPVLIDTKHKVQLNPSNLGLQIEKQRSQLFRFLTNFTLNRYISFQPILEVISCFSQIRGGIHYYPRVVVGDGLVIRKRQWVIKSADVDKNCFLDEGSFYDMVRDMFIAKNLPVDFFVQTDSGKELGFVQLFNPLHHKKLKKFIVENTKLTLIERLPDSEHSSKNDSNFNEIEFLMSWYEN